MKPTNTIPSRISAAVVFFTLYCTAYSATFVQADLSADYAITESPLAADQSGATPTSTFLAGAFGSNGQNGVYVFPLPVIGTGFTVSTADLQFTYVGAGTNDTGNARVDLWGIGFQSTTAPIVEYLEADTDTAIGNTKIQNDIVTPGTQPGEINTNATGDGLLGSYLQTFYNANPNYSGGSFVFLRLNPDGRVTTTGTSQGYRFEVAENASSDPALTITTVPEPSTSLLGILGLILFASKRSVGSILKCNMG